ncbi:MAG: hypothetical protein AAF684_02215 [Pseudomonadota bacterium]
MTDAFATARAADRLAHAWLVIGAPAAQPGLWARRRAAELLGLAPDALDDDEAAHPDFRRIAPPAPDKDIPIDAVRAVVGFLRMTAQGGWKAAVVEDADRLNRNAANALLKALEEPPPRTTLFLAAAAPGRLPVTVRSRCRRIRLDASETTAADLSADRPDAAADALAGALAAAGGDPALARAMIDAGLADLPAALRGLGEKAGAESERRALALAARVAAAGEAGRVGLIAAIDALTVDAARAGDGDRRLVDRRDAAVEILESQRRANLDAKRCAADALYAWAKLGAGAHQ